MHHCSSACQTVCSIIIYDFTWSDTNMKVTLAVCQYVKISHYFHVLLGYVKVSHFTTPFPCSLGICEGLTLHNCISNLSWDIWRSHTSLPYFHSLLGYLKILHFTPLFPCCLGIWSFFLLPWCPQWSIDSQPTHVKSSYLLPSMPSSNY